MKFEQMNLIRPILRAIREVGYTEPTPIQQKTIPPVLQGKDVLGCAQTGTGKTAAFALPILQRVARADDFDPQGERPIRALILTPTRELALQIYDNFVRYGKNLPVRSAVIFGGVNQNPQVEQLKAGVDVLVATPGRLNDLIGQGHISLRDIRIFVLDEADRMLDMGFIHDVRKVMAKLPVSRQTLLFSATMPPQVEEIAEQLLTDPINVKISPVTSTVDSVAQSVYFLAKADKTKLLLHLLNGHGVSNALVFTRTKHGADQVARQLNKNNVKALAIHGDKSQNSRQTALNRFKAGEIDVLVATDIAARGIDIAELPTVINYNVPEEPETYIHRIGRTGRAGQEGVAITFCCSDELESFRDIEKLICRSVEEKICEWSVSDMQPTKPERRQPQGRGGNPNSADRKNAPVQTEPTQARSRQEKKPSRPAEKKPTEAPAAEAEIPAAPKQQGRKSRAPHSESPKQNPKSGNLTKQTKQEAKTAKNTPKQESASSPAAPKKEQKGRENGAKREKNAKLLSRKADVKPTAVSKTAEVDRRYADSGEHDGATGQQIVTNFNRSVWLEFNDPPKRPKNMWQTPQAPAQSEAPKSEPAKQLKDGSKADAPMNRSGEKRRRFHRRRG